MARAPGLEPGSLAWKARAQPIYQARIEMAEGRRHDHHTVASAMPLAGAASALRLTFHDWPRRDDSNAHASA
jgi:DNA primase